MMIDMSIKVTPTFVLFRGGAKVHSHGGINETNLHRVRSGRRGCQARSAGCSGGICGSAAGGPQQPCSEPVSAACWGPTCSPCTGAPTPFTAVSLLLLTTCTATGVPPAPPAVRLQVPGAWRGGVRHLLRAGRGLGIDESAGRPAAGASWRPAAAARTRSGCVVSPLPSSFLLPHLAQMHQHIYGGFSPPRQAPCCALKFYADTLACSPSMRPCASGGPAAAQPASTPLTVPPDCGGATCCALVPACCSPLSPPGPPPPHANINPPASAPCWATPLKPCPSF
jgi:hypothetical protein